MNPTPLRKAVLAALATTLIWSVCCFAVARRSGFPEAGIHDEFSYLLGADTFAKGRLTNPPHPLGRFFESPHILVRPTYASKFPPGQALVLGLGEKLSGSPYYGVLLSGALMIFLLTTTLVAWTGLVPGLAVSAVLGLVFLPPMYWVYSYWGGCLAAAAGAAILLAFECYRRRHPIAAGVIFAGGVLTLFVTRPYEGGVFTAGAMMACGFLLYRDRGPTALIGVRPFIISAAALIVAGLLCVGRYNAAVTGNPFRLPHLLHESQYQTAPLLWFLPVRPEEPHYTHPRLAAEHGWSGPEFRAYRAVMAGGYYRTVNATLKSVGAISAGRWCSCCSSRSPGASGVFDSWLPSSAFVSWACRLRRFIIRIMRPLSQSRLHFCPLVRWKDHGAAGLGLFHSASWSRAWSLP